MKWFGIVNIGQSELQYSCTDGIQIAQYVYVLYLYTGQMKQAKTFHTMRKKKRNLNDKNSQFCVVYVAPICQSRPMTCVFVTKHLPHHVYAQHCSKQTT